MKGPILRALDALNEKVLIAESIGQSLDLLAGDEPPAWVHVYRTEVRAIQEAAETLESLLRGDGGYGPHVERCDGCYTHLAAGRPARSLETLPARPAEPSSAVNE